MHWGEADRAAKRRLIEPSQLTQTIAGRDNVHVSRGIVPEMPESNGASATPTPTLQGSDDASVRRILTSDAKLLILDPEFSPQVLARMPILAHGTYLLPPCTVTHQLRCGCATPKLYTERSVYIEKEAEFRRSRQDYCQSQRQYEQAMRGLLLFDAMLQAPDHERLPPMTRQG